MDKGEDKMKKFESFLQREVEKLKPRMLLMGQDIWFEQADEKDEDKECIFAVECAYPYRTARIDYHRRAVSLYKSRKFNELRWHLVHELLHVVLAPMARAAKRRFTTEDDMIAAEEQAVEHVVEILKGVSWTWKD